MITIEAKIAGRRRPVIPKWQIPPPVEVAGGGTPLTLRELISRIVREEVDSFRERERDRRFVRILSEQEIAVGRERGRVDPGGRRLHQQVHDETAVGVALQGFEDGLYLVLIDGHKYESLDEQVLLGTDSAITFLRLVPLAGG